MIAAQPPLHLDVFHAALVVADDPAVAERMRNVLIGIAPRRRVVVASSEAEARNLLASLPYDLVLVDMRLPCRASVPFIVHVRDKYPRCETIAMSATDDQDEVGAAITAGATGYLLTEADDIELTYLLRSVERGGAPMDSRIARRILGSIAASAKQQQQTRAIAPIRTQESVAADAPADGKDKLPRAVLSPRELKVLRLIAQGWSNRQIADAVYLSVNTIEFHAKSIYRKLSVKSRTQAVHTATQSGLLN